MSRFDTAKHCLYHPDAFVVCQPDTKRLKSLIGFQFNETTIFCSVPNDLDKLKAASEVWFIVSKISLLSTLFQEVVLTALSDSANILENAKCWLLPLDDVTIPC